MPTPSNPAPVSGPGALARRTDGGPADKQPIRSLPDAEYGANKEFREIQQGAPLYEQSPPPPAPPGLFDPTQFPDEPVTSGIASGPGSGPLPQLQPDINADVALIRNYLPSLRKAAGMVNAPPGFRYFVRYLETFNE